MMLPAGPAVVLQRHYNQPYRVHLRCFRVLLGCPVLCDSPCSAPVLVRQALRTCAEVLCHLALVGACSAGTHHSMVKCRSEPALGLPLEASTPRAFPFDDHSLSYVSNSLACSRRGVGYVPFVVQHGPCKVTGLLHPRGAAAWLR